MLTQEQEDAIQYQGDMVRKCLRLSRDMKFEVGTFLIKKMLVWRDGKHVWVTEKFNKTRDVPRKYKVVAVDEFGLPFIRKVLYNGVLHKTLEYMANKDLTYIYYEVDPDMQYHVLLGEDEKAFNPQTTYRQERFGHKTDSN